MVASIDSFVLHTLVALRKRTKGGKKKIFLGLLRSVLHFTAKAKVLSADLTFWGARSFHKLARPFPLRVCTALGSSPQVTSVYLFHIHFLFSYRPVWYLALCTLFFFRLAACICDVCFVTRPSADDDDDGDDEDNKKQFTICLLYLSFFLSPLFRTCVAFVVVASRTLMCSVNRGSINSKSCTKSRSDLRF